LVVDAKFASPNGKKFGRKYICLRHLHRILSKGNSTMKMYLLAGNSCNAQSGFVFVRGHDNHNNDSKAGNDTADDNDPNHWL